MATQALGGSSNSGAPAYQARSRNSLRAGSTAYRPSSNATRSLSSPTMREGGPVPASAPNVAVPTGMISPSSNGTMSPQPPQNSALYDSRTPVQGRRVPDASTETTEGTQRKHTRGGKSVEILPSQLLGPQQQQPLPPQQQQAQSQAAPKVLHKRQSVRTPSNKNKRASRMDQASFDTDGDDMHDEDAKDRRGSGSLRSVFRKMFSSKSRKDEVAVPKRPATRGQDTPSKNHWPDEERRLASREGAIKNFDKVNKRHDPIMSIPVHEITPKTPLGSHLPFPMNVNAPQDSTPRQNLPRQSFDTPESPSKSNRRRATLPSLVLSQTDLAALSNLWEQEDQDTVTDVVRKTAPSPHIGMAITSASAHSSNRRSRSADDLAGIARDHAQYERQTPLQKRASSRAAEIEYWRASFSPISLESIEHEPAPATRVQADPVYDTRPSNETSVRTAQASAEPPSHEAISFEENAPTIQPQFHERLNSTIQRADSAAGGRARQIEIFRPSPDQARNFSRPGAHEGLEDPEGWENRLSKLELMMKKLQHTRNRSTIIVDNTPRRRDASGSPQARSIRSPDVQSRDVAGRRHEQPPESPRSDVSPAKTQTPSPRTPKTQMGAQYNSGILPQTAHITDPNTWMQPQTTSTADLNASSNGSKAPQNFYNPTGAPPADSGDLASTPRPQTSHAVPSSLPSPNMYDHLAPLYAALSYERSKRKEFEVQIIELRQQLDDLTHFVQSQYETRKLNGYDSNPSREHVGYPTPSPEEIFSGSFSGDEHVATTLLQPPSRFSGLDFDSESAYSDTHVGIDRKSRMYDGAVDDDDDETDGEHTQGEKEVYGTPMEELTMSLPAEPPPVSHVPVQSRIPTPKQSMKNIRPSTAGREVRGQPSYGSLGNNGSKNRFGFAGGKA